MILILIILLSWGLLEYLFFINHQYPLSEEEIDDLSNKRQKKINSSLYHFKQYDLRPDKEFKANMNPNGQFYRIDMDVKLFPSYVAQLLKYKKYEWSVVGMADDSTAKLVWINRGIDNSATFIGINFSSLISMAQKNSCKIVLGFHNHPNSNPQKYNMLMASKQDYISARKVSEYFNGTGIAFLEYVCERGKFREYYRYFPADFKCGNASKNAIISENGKSKWKNYKLHRELGFFKGWF